MRKLRTYEQLERLEIFSYQRWQRQLSPYWERLALASHRAVKAHTDYRVVL